MRKRIKRRLRSQNGETIAEVLIALLISAIALMMLAQMVGNSTGLIVRSEETMDEYYEAVNPLADRNAADKTGMVTFSCVNMKPFESLSVKYTVCEKKMGDKELVAFYYDKSGVMP